MKRIHLLQCIYFIATCLAVTSCKKVDDYLDKAESGGQTLEQVFGSFVQSERFLANVYSRLPSEYATKYCNASDEAKSPHGTSAENQINNGVFSPAGNPYNNWTATYQAIRSVNIFLANAHKIPVLNAEQEKDKPRMTGEAHFLRAFFYADLFRRWGGVPIIEQPLDVTENMQIPRNTAEEVVEFIVKECDAATELLGTEYTSNHLGRATKGAAMALKARVLLYAASPLHNPSGAAAKWERAAAAAKDIMAMQFYELHNNYKLLFHTRVSKEIIFQHTVNYTDYTLQTFIPSLGGQVGVAPLQNMVDEYEMSNGQQPFLKGQTGLAPAINPASGYNPANPYVNRDPRFYMSILYNGASWHGTTVYTYFGAPSDGINGGFNNTPTGYYLAKTVDETANRTPSVRNGNNYWIYFRYAEVLLNYAEALNESLEQPSQDVYNAVNAIRSRPGVNMPPLPAGLSKEQMRERIRHERKIELAFEGHRFFDIKRWRIGLEVMPDAYGMMVTRSTSGGYQFERFFLERRVYRRHYDLFPIMQTEINRNAALVQNPDYN
ncbi:RagB/SusD family nutrient uptake outer membrane protein [Chitinophaga sp.]|uniref:RagB/SusD family nutrient uptake outer membrane protein n=1 Tax=Chitinophaga sp. TaxID=1869181 RepID=UPI0031DFE045